MRYTGFIPSTSTPPPRIAQSVAMLERSLVYFHTPSQNHTNRRHAGAQYRICVHPAFGQMCGGAKLNNRSSQLLLAGCISVTTKNKQPLQCCANTKEKQCCWKAYCSVFCGQRHCTLLSFDGVYALPACTRVVADICFLASPLNANHQG